MAADMDEARAVAERLARAQCPGGEIDAVLRVKFGLPLESVMTRAEADRIECAGQAELRARLYAIAMGEVESSTTATSTAVWLSRQCLGHRSDPRAGDQELRAEVDRLGAMSEAELAQEVERLRALIAVE